MRVTETGWRCDECKRYVRDDPAQDYSRLPVGWYALMCGENTANYCGPACLAAYASRQPEYISPSNDE